MGIHSVPNEIVLLMIDFLPTRAVYQLLTISRRFFDLALRNLFIRMQTALQTVGNCLHVAHCAGPEAVPTGPVAFYTTPEIASDLQGLATHLFSGTSPAFTVCPLREYRGHFVAFRPNPLHVSGTFPNAKRTSAQEVGSGAQSLSSSIMPEKQADHNDEVVFSYNKCLPSSIVFAKLCTSSPYDIGNSIRAVLFEASLWVSEAWFAKRHVEEVNADVLRDHHTTDGPGSPGINKAPRDRDLIWSGVRENLGVRYEVFIDERSGGQPRHMMRFKGSQARNSQYYLQPLTFRRGTSADIILGRSPGRLAQNS